MATAIDNFFENLRGRLRGSQLAHFFGWWFRELAEMLPAGLKAKMQHARRRVLLKLDDRELSLSLHESDHLQEIEVLSIDQDPRLQRQRLYDILLERELSEVARDFVLPESRVLRKEVILPLATEANLRQALSFEMDRQTPFHANDVFFDYRVTQRERESAQLRVDMLVTLKQPLLKEIEALVPLGMTPTGVDVDIGGLPAGVNLLPPEMRHRIVNSKSRTNFALLAASVFLLVVVMAQSVLLRQHQLNEVNEAIEEVREEAMQVQQIRDRITDASEAAGFMQARRAESMPAVKVLNEVTRLLPDDTFLDRLLIGSDTVQMQGKSQNAQRLIELVNSSDFFKDAAFRGPTRLDSRTQKEIFDLTTKLVYEGDS